MKIKGRKSNFLADATSVVFKEGRSHNKQNPTKTSGKKGCQTLVLHGIFLLYQLHGEPSFDFIHPTRWALTSYEMRL